MWSMQDRGRDGKDVDKKKGEESQKSVELIICISGCVQENEGIRLGFNITLLCVCCLLPCCMYSYHVM